MKRILSLLAALLLAAQPALAADRKPIVIGSTGQQQQIQSSDTASVPALKVTAGTTDVQADVRFSGDITPSQITSSQNDYSPTGLSTAAVLRLSTDASRNLTGLAGGADGRWITIVNVGSFDLVLKDESSSSSAANRFALDADLTLGADTAAVLIYDSTTTRWRLAGVGKATGGGSGTVTSVAVSSSDSTLAINSGSPVTGAGTIDLSVLKWKTARTLTLGTDLSGSVSFDGSANFTLNATIPNSTVTLAKIANAAASSKLLGSGASGSGSPYAEITLGTGLSMSGTTLNGISSGGTITTASITPPQGRLTLITGVPVMTSDQTAKTHVYWTNYVGPNVPIYDGSNWALYSLSSDLDMALDTTNQLVENVYDLFIWNNSGSISIGAGPAWTTSATITVTIATPGVVTWTAHGLYEGAPVIFTTSGALPTGITAGTTYYVGKNVTTNTFSISTSVANAAAGTYVNTSGSQSGTHTGTNHTTARGTGAGTTELQMLNGIWTNKNSITLTNGAGGGTSVSANRATYVGSSYMTANGQTGMAFSPAAASGGANPILGVYNAYNRLPTTSTNLDNEANYAYNVLTWRAAGNSTSNRVWYLDGLGQSYVTGISSQAVGSASSFGTGMSRDSTSADPQLSAQGVANSSQTAHDAWAPSIGVNYIQQQEWGQSANFIARETGPVRQKGGTRITLGM